MKTVLVTGSSKGIGKSTICEFASNNYNVVITYNTDYESACALKKYVENNYKVNVLVIKCDISNENDVSNMVTKIIDEFSNIDILVNNAALSLDSDIVEKTKNEFMRVLEVNLVGTFLVTREVITRTKVSTIINVSSTDSVDTYNTLNIDYSSSKAGINILTKTFALKYNDIKICAVLPNFVDTEAIREMNQDYLKEEMNRINQKKLIDLGTVSRKIYEIVNNDNIKSGDLIRIEE